MNYSRVAENLNLYRDNSSGAIINSNANEYENYLQQKKLKEQQANKIEKIEDDIRNIKSDLSEIKNLLRNLANGSN